MRPCLPARERRGRTPSRPRATASARPAPGPHQSTRPAALGPAHSAARSQSDARPAARAAVVMVPRPTSAAVSSAAMAALRGRALLAPLGARLRAGPRAPLRSTASNPPLYDVVVSGGGMVGSAMAAVLGKAVTASPQCEVTVYRISVSGVC